MVLFYLTTFLGPVVLGVLIAIAWLFLERLIATKGRPEPIFLRLCLAGFLAVAGAGITLVGTIAWMSWYERTTGFDAGNAPVAWIFFFGPVGVLITEVVGFLVWWFGHRKKARVTGGNTAVNH